MTVLESRLRDILRDNTSVTVEAVALRIGTNEETAVALLRKERAPMYVKAGALWVRGRKPRRPAPGWMKESA